MQIRDILKNNYSKEQITRLEMELLLSHVLQVTRVYLYMCFALNISEEQYARFLQLMQRRLQGEPLAYILGTCEFWDLQFSVTSSVLIPRPETELLIEIALQLLDKNKNSHVADLGTGSGAVALALAHECNNWQIYATDNSWRALQVAKRNIQDLKLTNITCLHGEWCNALPQKQFDAIISNPPYIAINDPYVQESVRQFEPPEALFAGEDGLDAIRQIIKQAPKKLIAQGWLLLEHGFLQGESVRELLRQYGFCEVQTHKDLSGHDRVTIGRSGCA